MTKEGCLSTDCEENSDDDGDLDSEDDLILDEMAEIDSVETEIEDNNYTDILDQEADEESSVFPGNRVSDGE